MSLITLNKLKRFYNKCKLIWDSLDERIEETEAEIINLSLDINSTNSNIIKNETDISIVKDTLGYEKKNLFNGINQGYYIDSTATAYRRTTADSGSIVYIGGESTVTVSTTITQMRYRVCMADSELEAKSDITDLQITICDLYESIREVNDMPIIYTKLIMKGKKY